MPPIYNYEVYQTAMKSSLYDKLFFVDKIINPTTIVDFGCADGTLMREIQHYYPDIPVIGIDNDPNMREKAKDLEIIPSLKDAEKGEGSVLVLSSVLHELYHYGEVEEINDFWEEAKKFEYVVIRDMALEDYVFKNYPSEQEDVDKIWDMFPAKAQDFEDVWGSLNKRHNMMHFLLKYMYDENWYREVQENYIINTPRDLQKNLYAEYRFEHIEHKVLPYLQQKWENDLDIYTVQPTHYKLIAKRRDSYE